MSKVRGKPELPKLNFRDQVGLFLGNREQDWPTLRWMVGAVGGNIADMVEILIWRLHDQGKQGKGGSNV
jgi:hypothetical protein